MSTGGSAYASGYAAGESDGLAGKDHAMAFNDYTYSLGYRAGYDAGNARRVFQRHAGAEDFWCSTCGRMTNHRTLGHTAAMGEA